ncbi:ABC transporter permease [Konateibacter massiliensis]|uniref:permease n=1 Tax=Konateibacter massiliensis TaxID=2002841 RepID=UPI000C15DB05|nr:permease [Konateibacter massiliensis]
MKNNIAILLKIILINQFKLNKLKETKGSEKAKFVMIGVAVCFVGAILALYSFMLGLGLGVIGIGNVIPGYAITLVGLITLFFTIFKSNGVLFGTRDYEMLMSLPVKTSEIIASRFLHMYLMNTIFAALIMLPLGITYYIFEKPQEIFAIIWLIGILLSTLLPTALAAIIGGIIAYIAAHFKYTNAVATIFSIVFVIGILMSSFLLGGVEESDIPMMEIAKLGEFMSDELHKIYPISSLFDKAVINYDIIALILFVVLSIGLYLLFVKVLSLRYKWINTALITHRTKSDYKLQRLSTSSVLTALYKKELKRFFSSYSYILNMGIGAVMAVMLAVAVFIAEPATIEKWIEIPNVQPIIVNIIAFVFSTVLALTCTTSVALSLEGKNLWILKSLPITTKAIMDSKILVNLTLTLPTCLLFGTLMNIKFQTDIITRCFFYLVPVVYSLFTAVWGMFINTRFPNYEWESETAVIKQGLSSMVGMLGGALFAIVPIIVLIALQNVSYQLISGITILVVSAAGSVLYHRLGTYRL